MDRYADRRHAGSYLADKLEHYRGQEDVVVLALPRGGVPVGYEVAQRLCAPLDVFVVRKLGLPGQEELAMGAIASGGARVLNEEVLQALPGARRALDEVAQREQHELDRQELLYRGQKPALDVAGKIAILVDDGLATGSSMRAAIAGLKALGPARIVVAVPVGAASTCEELRQTVDEVVCARTPDPFYAVGLWYEDFSQTGDDEVRELLETQRCERARFEQGEQAAVEGP